MRLVSMRLKNFRKFVDQSIEEFPDGLVGIIGDNGAGKSSIVEAIGWAIYGEIGGAKDKEGIRNLNGDPEGECRVELCFELDGDNYHVVRSMDAKNKIVAWVEVNGKEHVKKADERATDATKFLTRQLGMDKKTFFVSFVARQGELNALASERPEQRKKLLTRMLGVDRLDTGIRKLTQDTTQQKRLVQELERLLPNLDALEAERDELKDELDGLEEQESGELGKLRSLKEKREKLEKTLNELKGQKEDYENLQRRKAKEEGQQGVLLTQLQQREDRLLELQGKVRELSELAEKVAEYDELLEENEHLQQLQSRQALKDQLRHSKDKLQSLRTTILALESYLADHEDVPRQLEQKEKQISDLDREIRTTESNITEKNTILRTTEKERTDLETQRDEIVALGKYSPCPKCTRPLGEDYKRVVGDCNGEIEDKLSTEERLRLGLHQLQSSLEHYSSSKLGLQSEIDNLEELQVTVNGKKKELQIRQQEEKELSHQVESLDVEVGAELHVEYNPKRHNWVQGRLAMLKPAHDRASILKTEVSEIDQVVAAIKRLERDLEEVKQRILGIGQEVSALGFSPTHYVEFEGKYDHAVQDAHDQELALERLRGEQGKLRIRIQGKEEAIQKGKKDREVYREQHTQYQYMNELGRLFRDLRANLVDRIKPTLSTNMSRLVGELSDGKYTVAELDDQYQVQVQDGGQLFPIERFSGGEQDLINLCLRLSISMLLTDSSGPGPGFIVLDEIFGSQDQKRRDRVMETISKLRALYKQIILITHVDNVKDMIPNAIEVVEHEDDRNSTITLDYQLMSP